MLMIFCKISTQMWETVKAKQTYALSSYIGLSAGLNWNINDPPISALKEFTTWNSVFTGVVKKGLDKMVHHIFITEKNFNTGS